MCFGNKTTQTTKVELPKWLESGGQDLLKKAQALYAKPSVPYTGQRVAGLNSDINSGLAGLRELMESPSVTGAATGLITDATKAPISTERTVDENGRLGSIESYMNPYIEAVLAPTLRKIEEASAAARKTTSAQANMAGAFGDARHGIAEAGVNRDSMLATGDAAGRAYAGAFDTALATRGADLNRFLSADTTAFDQAIRGAAGLMSTQAAGTQDALSKLTALLAGGDIQRSTEQANLDADYQEFLRGQSEEYQKLDALIRSLGGAGGTAGQTQTTAKPDNSGFSLLGSLLGAMVGV